MRTNASASGEQPSGKKYVVQVTEYLDDYKARGSDWADATVQSVHDDSEQAYAYAKKLEQDWFLEQLDGGVSLFPRNAEIKDLYEFVEQKLLADSDNIETVLSIVQEQHDENYPAGVLELQASYLKQEPVPYKKSEATDWWVEVLLGNNPKWLLDSELFDKVYSYVTDGEFVPTKFQVDVLCVDYYPSKTKPKPPPRKRRRT